MSEDDAKLLDHVKVLFWIRLAALEERAKTTGANPLVERKASNLRPTEAGWLKATHDPTGICQRLAAIRCEAEHGSFYKAWVDLERMQRNADHAWQLASRRILETGWKQTDTLDQHRANANAPKKVNAAKRQKIVAEMVTGSKRSGGSLERWLVDELKKCDVVVSRRTIRRDLEILRKVGQTG